MHPKELSQKADSISQGLNFKERFLMKWRPWICPFHILMEHVPQGSSVLDIGCGNGLWLFLLWRLGRISEGIGIEINQAKIDAANSLKKNEDKLEFTRFEPKDKWRQRSYQCVTMIDVLHHVRKDKQKDFISQIAQSNSKRIIFKEIDTRPRIKNFMNTLHDLLLSREFPKYYQKDQVVRWLEEFGYRISYTGKYDMLWYSHYIIVADKE